MNMQSIVGIESLHFWRERWRERLPAMGKISHRPAPVTGEGHRVTAFEIFFDLVFVFAFTRIISFMIHDLTPLTLLQGLLLLVLMWWAWSAYAWLGNQVRADEGWPLAGGVVAMAAIFVVAILIPEAFHDSPGGINAPLTLAIAYSIVRVLYLATYMYASSGDRELRNALTRLNILTIISWVPFIAGALIGGYPQVVLWTATFIIDFGGGAASTSHGGWRLRTTGYFAERHGLVVIIALGESLAAVGAGVGAVAVSGPILMAALLGLGLAVCLWLLYFRSVGPIAERRLAETQGTARARVARDAFTFLHFALIAGVIYIAVGIEEVLAQVSDAHGIAAHDPNEPLGWIAIIALYGGVATYLTGRAAIVWRTTMRWSTVQLTAVGVILLLTPLARAIPALAALGLITAALVGLAFFETAAWNRRRVGGVRAS